MLRRANTRCLSTLRETETLSGGPHAAASADNEGSGSANTRLNECRRCSNWDTLTFVPQKPQDAWLSVVSRLMSRVVVKCSMKRCDPFVVVVL